MNVSRVRIDAFALPLCQPLHTARGAIEWRRGVVLRVEAQRGLVGAGELAPHPLDAAAKGTSSLADEVRTATAWLEGVCLDRLDDALARARRAAPWIAAGVDAALHDLAARAAGKSVAELLGGARRAAVAANATLLGGSADELGRAAAAAAAGGFTVVKLKLPSDVGQGLERLRAVRAAAPGVRVRGDANGTWDEPTARAALPQLVALGLQLLEQPLPVGDLDGLARLRRLTAELRRASAPPRLSIAADEAVTGAAAVAEIARRAAADAIVLKLCQTGGLVEAMRAASTAASAGLAVIVTTALDASIATAAALQLAAAVPGPLEPCGVATTHLLAGDLVAQPIASRPRMAVPAGPGIGVEVDDAQLARWRDA